MIVPQLIEELSKIGFLTDHLSLPSIDKQVDFEPCTYMGLCKLDKPGAIHRRIDIKSYPRSMFPFAILYFTGSDYFNRYNTNYHIIIIISLYHHCFFLLFHF